MASLTSTMRETQPYLRSYQMDVTLFSMCFSGVVIIIKACFSECRSQSLCVTKILEAQHESDMTLRRLCDADAL